MKKLLLVLCCILSIQCIAQSTTALQTILPDEAYENIHVKKLYSDSNVTSYVIWVKNNVRAHKHEKHSESLYVIEGSAMMIIGDKEIDINAGDYFTIPENTVHSVKVKSDIPLKVLSLQTPQFLGQDRIFID